MPSEIPTLVTKADAAAIFGVCVKTIDNYVSHNLMPAPVPFGSRSYWHAVDFKAFLDDRFLRQSAPSATSGLTNQAAVNAQPEKAREASHSPSVSNKRAEPRDSNPVVRQQAREKALLRELNATPSE